MDNEKRQSRIFMKEEAIKRMLKLGLEAGPINDLALREKIVCSDNGMFKDVPEEIKKKSRTGKRNTIILFIM